MKNIWYFFAGCMVICIASADDVRFNCSNVIVNGLRTTLCESNSKKISRLPENIPRDVQNLSIKLNDVLGAYRIDKTDEFLQFSSLLVLNIESSRGLLFNTIEKTSHRLRDIFNVPYLEILSLKFMKELVVEHNLFVLPESLREVHLSNVTYDFDFQHCSHLEVLNLYNNSLTKLPYLHYPPPPLKKLFLTKNPLNEMVVDDIAGLCELEFLAINGTSWSYCECRKFEMWIDKLRKYSKFVFAGDLNCTYKICDDCAMYSLQKANYRRELCLARSHWYSLRLIAVFSALMMIPSLLSCGFLALYIQSSKPESPMV